MELDKNPLAEVLADIFAQAHENIAMAWVGLLAMSAEDPELRAAAKRLFDLLDGNIILPEFGIEGGNKND